MKDTRNLIITRKDRYLTLKEAVILARDIIRLFKEETEIKVAGKNKAVVKFKEEIEDSKYNYINKRIQEVDFQIYNESRKHKNRIYKVKSNLRRREEEDECNVLIRKVN